MADDAVSRLLAVEPLPRGERMVRWSEALERRKGHAWRLICRSRVLGVLHDSLYEDPPSSRAWFWWYYADPLRKAREKARSNNAAFLAETRRVLEECRRDLDDVERALSEPRERFLAGRLQVTDAPITLVLSPPERFVPTLFPGEFQSDDEEDEG